LGTEGTQTYGGRLLRGPSTCETTEPMEAKARAGEG